MHIEINSGSLSATGTIAELYDNLNRMIGSSEDIISSFKTVENKTCNLNGGVGSLGDALNYVQERIRSEEEKLSHTRDVLTQTVIFTEHAIRTDNAVAEIVKQNKEEFYQMHPWLRPPKTEDEKNCLEKAWDNVKEGFKKVGEAIDEAFQAIGDTLRKGWEMLVEFYEEHKKIIQTVLIVIGAIAAIVAVVSGGGLLVLAPLLTAIGFSAPVAAAISGAVAVIAVVSTIASSSLNIVDIWFEIDTPLFNKIQKALNITAAISNALVSIGALYNSFHPGALDDVKEQLLASQQPKPAPGATTAKFNDGVELADNPLNEGEYFVKGDHTDDFMDYWTHSENYTHTDIANPQMEYISPNDIEGVYMHGGEVQNPDIFYRNYSQQDYLNYINSGAMNEAPVELYQVIDNGKSYYVFAGDGRHRIIAAKEMGQKIPAIIRTIYRR